MTDAGSTPIRVLHVDDDSGVCELVAIFLERVDDRFEVTSATTVEEGLDLLEAGDVDCIVSDYDLPRTNGIDFLKAVREHHPDLPFVLFTGKGSEAVASEAISAGVTEYMQKEVGTDQYLVLANRVLKSVERHRAQLRLVRSERRHRRVMETSPTPIVLFGPDRTIDYANDAALRMVGAVSAEEIVGRPVLEFVHPTSEALVRERMDTVLNERESVPVVEQQYTDADGETVHAVVATAPVRYDGKDGGQALIVDVTDLEEVKRELAAEQAFVEQALDVLDDVFYVLDRDGDLVRINAKVSEVTGLSKDEALSMDPLDFFPSEERDRVEASIQEAFETGESELRAAVRAATGEVLTFEFRKRPLTDVDGSLVGIAGIGRDVTRHESREAELSRVRERMGFALRSTDAIVWEWDVEADEVTFYPAAGDLYAEGIETLEDLLDRIHEEDVAAVREAIEGALATHATFQVDFRVDGDGGRWIRSRAEVETEDGEAVRLVGLAQDVTEQKRRERRLEAQTEELETLNRVVRHDIRNDMAVVLGWAQMLDDHVDEGGQDYLRKVLEGGERVVELTNVAREFVETLTGETSLPVGPTPLRPVLSTEVDLRRESDPSAEFLVRGEIPDVEVRANEMLHSVFRNLLVNAVEHSDRDHPEVEVRADVGPESVTVVIADDGPGIPADRTEAIFRKGEKGDESGGTGVGLYLVSTLVEQFGGDVWAENRESRGAKFCVSLPRVDAGDTEWVDDAGDTEWVDDADDTE